ncbi:DNA polymerase III subunit epsilon [Bacillus sp. M6-12]|nr:DNA polymerase III subunit epsilon [Bacillus sp. M6-12]
MRKSITCPLISGLALSTPLEDLSFTVFDTETTKFKVATEDRLFEIGAVAVKGFTVQEDQQFQIYVNLNRQISREIIELTNITNEMVAGKPAGMEAINQFFEFVRNQESVSLVGHYISFDMFVLQSELMREKLSLKYQNTIDTLDLIGFLAPSYDIRDIERYAMAFNTRIYPRHSAIGEALTTAYLFAELLRQFSERGHKTGRADPGNSKPNLVALACFHRLKNG